MDDSLDNLPPALRGLLLAVCENRLDDAALGALADWLEEHGRAESGLRVRLLRPRPGDVLFLWPDEPAVTADGIGAGKREYLCGLVDTFAGKLGLPAVAMIHPGQRVEHVSPHALRDAGWVRVEELEAALVDAPQGSVARLAQRIRYRAAGFRNGAASCPTAETQQLWLHVAEALDEIATETAVTEAAHATAGGLT